MRTTRKTTLLAATTTLAVGLGLSAAALGAGAATAATTSGHQAAKPQFTPTAFALRMSGYGTRVKGGDVPGRSSTTGYQVIGCTNDAGKVKTNHEAESQLPGLGTMSAVATRVWTTQKAGVTSAWSRHTVGSVTLSDSPLGTLLIDAVATTARAYHDAKGFHTYTNTDIGGLRFKPAAGQTQTLPIPAPGDPVEIPGFGTVTIGHSNVHKHAHSSVAFANGLKVELTASHSVVRIAHAEAEIHDGIISGVFNGSAAGLSGTIGDDLLDLGRNPLSVMPCKGTQGRVLQKTLAGASGEDQVTTSGLHNEQKAQQTENKAWGFERSTVESFGLGGQLSIEGIVAQANVSRHGKDVVRSSKGTQLGTVTANGEEQTFPDTDVLEIPGVARLERGIVTKYPGGIKVIGLRVTLLDGSGAVIDLATAKLRVGRSGLN